MLDIAKASPPESVDEIKTLHLIPAFMLSELKTAFQIGFIIFLPFLLDRYRGIEHPDVDGHAHGTADDDFPAVEGVDVCAD